MSVLAGVHASERAAEVWSAWRPKEAHEIGLETSIDERRNAVRVSFLITASSRENALRVGERELRRRNFVAMFYESSATVVELPLPAPREATAPG